MENISVLRRLYIENINCDVNDIKEIILKIDDKTKRDILSLFFGIENNLYYDENEIAELLNLSIDQVRQVITEIRQYLKSLNFPEFTDLERAKFEVVKFIEDAKISESVTTYELKVIKENISKLLPYSIKATQIYDNLLEQLDTLKIRIIEDHYAQDEQIELVKKYQETHDEQILEKLIKMNDPFIRKIVSKYYGTSLEYDDIYQEAVIGYINAINKFDTSKNYKLLTYAYWWIIQNIGRELMNKDTLIRRPIHLQQDRSKVLKVYQELSEELDRMPTIEEIVDKTGISKSTVKNVIETNYNISSLDATLTNRAKSDETDSTLGEFIVDDRIENFADVAFAKEKREKVLEALNQLDEREKKVIYYRFGFDNERIYTLEEIASMLGITRERVRQIESKALRLLRQHTSNLRHLIYYDDNINTLLVYEYFKDYSPVLVEVFINNLTKDLTNIFYRIVNKKDLMPNFIGKSEESIKAYEKVLQLIKKDLEKIYSSVNSKDDGELLKFYNTKVNLFRTQNSGFYNFSTASIYFDCSQGLIDVIISNLSAQTRNKFKKIFGPLYKNAVNLANLSAADNSFLYNLYQDIKKYKELYEITQSLDTIRTAINSPGLTKKVYYNDDVFKLFSEYKKEDIIATLNRHKKYFKLLCINDDYTLDLKRVFASEYFLVELNKFENILENELLLNKEVLIEEYLELTRDEVLIYLDYILIEDYKYILNKFSSSLNNEVMLDDELLRIKRAYRQVAKLIRIKDKSLHLVCKKYKTNLYEYFSFYNKETVINCIMQLNTDDQEYLKQAYKKDYSKAIRIEELDTYLKDKINNILSDLKYKLAHFERKQLTIYERFNSYPQELVHFVVASVGGKLQRSILRKVYGQNLDQKSDMSKLTMKEKTTLSNIHNNVIYNRLEEYFELYKNGLSIKEIREVLTNSGRKKTLGTITLYEKYYKYPKELVEYLLNNQKNIECLNILKKVYGENYNQNCDDSLLTAEEKILLKNVYRNVFDVPLRKMKKSIDSGKTIDEIISGPKELWDIKVYNSRKKITLYEGFNSYPPELIDLLIKNTVKPLNQDIMKKVYGEDFSLVENKSSLSKDETRVFYNLIAILSKKLKDFAPFYEDDITYDELLERKKNSKNQKIKEARENRLKITIYEKYKKYPKELVDLAINSIISDKRMELLKKIYGAQLDQKANRKNLSEEDTKLLNSIFIFLNKKLKKYDELLDKGLNFEEIIRDNMGIKKKLFANYSTEDKESVRSVVQNMLKLSEYNLLKEVYGKDLEKRANFKNLSNSQIVKVKKLILIQIPKLLKNPVVKQRQYVNKTLYEAYFDYNKEIIDLFIKNYIVDPRYITILKKVYGENYDQICNLNVLSDNEKRLFRYIHTRYFQAKLCTNNFSDSFTIYDRYKESPKELIDAIIKNIKNEEYIRILKKVYGENYDKNEKRNDLSKKELKQLENIYSNHFVRKIKIYNNLLEQGKQLEEIINEIIQSSSKEFRKKETLTTIYERYSDYPKELIDAIIKNIKNEKSITILKRVYGENYDKVENKDDLSKDEIAKLKNIYSNHFVRKIKIYNNLLEQGKTIEEILNKNKALTLYERYKEYPKEQIDAIIASIKNEESISVLKRVYGENYDKEENRDGLSKTEITILSNIYTNHFGRKIKIYNNLLEQGKALEEILNKNKPLTLYERYKDCPNELIDAIIKSIKHEEYISILKRVYGENYDKVENRDSLSKSERIMLNSILCNHFKKKIIKYQKLIKQGKTLEEILNKNKPLTLYEKYKECSSKIIDEIIKGIKHEEYIKILKKVYGDNYDKEENRSALNKKELIQLDHIYSYHFKKKIEKYQSLIVKGKSIEEIFNKTGKSQTIYERYKAYSKEIIDAIIKSITNEEYLNILKKVYGDNYDKEANISLLSKREKRQLDYIYSTYFIKKLRKYVDNTLSLEEKYSEVPKEYINLILDNIDNKEYIVILKKVYGENYDQKANTLLLDSNELKTLNRTYYVVFSKKIKRITKLLKEGKSFEQIKAEMFFKNKTLEMKFSRYEKEILNFVIENINNEEYLNVLKKVYGEELNQVESLSNLNDEEKQTLKSAYNYLYKRIRKVTKFAAEGKDLKTLKNKTLYETYDKYSSELIDYIISTIEKTEYLKILKKVYGEDLKGSENKLKLTKEEKEIFRCTKHYISTKITRYNDYINNGKALEDIKFKNKTLYEKYKEYPIELIDLIITTITSENHLNVLKKVYGNDLKQNSNNSILNKEEYNILRSVNGIIKKRLEKYNDMLLNQNVSLEELPISKIESKKNIDGCTLYERFDNYSKEIIDYIVENKINKDFKEVIKRVYGETLHKTGDTSTLSTDEKTSLYNAIYTIKKQIRKYNEKAKDNKTIYEKYSQYSKEFIDMILSNITNENKLSILKKVYGDNFDLPANTILLTSEEKKQLSHIYSFSFRKKLIKIDELYKKGYSLIEIKKQLFKTIISNETIYERYSEYSKERIDYVLNKLKNEKYITILKKVYGENYDQKANIDILTKEEREFLYKQIFYRWLKPRLSQESNLIPQTASKKTNRKSRKKKNRKEKTIYELYSDYDKSVIDDLIKSITNQEYVATLKKVYGENFDLPANTIILNAKEKKQLYNIRQNWIAKKLGGFKHKDKDLQVKVSMVDNKKGKQQRKRAKYNQSIFEYIRTKKDERYYSDEEIKETILSFSKEHQELLLSAWNCENMEESVQRIKLSEEESKKLNSLISQIRKKLRSSYDENGSKKEKVSYRKNKYNQNIFDYIRMKKDQFYYSDEIIAYIIENQAKEKVELIKKAWNCTNINESIYRINLGKEENTKLNIYINEIRMKLKNLYEKANNTDIEYLKRLYDQLYKVVKQYTLKDRLMSLDNTYDYNEEIIELIYKNEIDSKYKNNAEYALKILLRKVKAIYEEAKDPNDLDEIKSIYLKVKKYKVIKVEKSNLENINSHKIENILLNSDIANELKNYLPIICVYATVLSLKSIIGISLDVRQIAQLLNITVSDAYKYIALGIEVLEEKKLKNINREVQEAKLKYIKSK